MVGNCSLVVYWLSKAEANDEAFINVRVYCIPHGFEGAVNLVMLSREQPIPNCKRSETAAKNNDASARLPNPRRRHCASGVGI